MTAFLVRSLAVLATGLTLVAFAAYFAHWPDGGEPRPPRCPCDRNSERLVP